MKRTLDVEYPPEIEWEGPHHMNATDGEANFEIQIPFQANPRTLTFRWWKLLQSGSERSRAAAVEEEIPQERVTAEGSLRFADVEKSDEGRYRVEVANSLGVATFEIAFYVLCEYD